MNHLGEAAAELAAIRAICAKRQACADAIRGDGQAPAADVIDAEVAALRFRLADRFIALAAIDARAGVIDVPFPPDMEAP